ncbi:uncharacterized protein [Gossypium hirsutum]|uniref:Uncharacterized protein n=1 Tax=Gossypium hirsutum TaxID=3635 RepID=A0A1U8IXQ7_GOSHI|nr:uncharacterized protein LOC107899938 [Gossypium hirsutum]
MHKIVNSDKTQLGNEHQRYSWMGLPESVVEGIERPKKKVKVDGTIRVGALIAATGQLSYTDCGRCHQGECWKRIVACLRWGSLEHRIRECPQRSDLMLALGISTVPPPTKVQQPPRGRGLGRGQRAPDRGVSHTEARQLALVYVVHRREDGDALDVITNIGSTHSYIAYIVSENLGILVESTTGEVTVQSPLRQLVKVNKLFRYVPLEFQGAIFLVDLMELPFGVFDLILGMGWLVKHRVS